MFPYLSWEEHASPVLTPDWPEKQTGLGITEEPRGIWAVMTSLLEVLFCIPRWKMTFE